MRKTLFAALLLVCVPMFAENAKTFDATYTATVAKVPAGLAEMDVWIPLPETRGYQHVSNVIIDAPFKFTRHTEKEFGNQYAYATIPNPPIPSSVTISSSPSRIATSPSCRTAPRVASKARDRGSGPNAGFTYMLFKINSGLYPWQLVGFDF